ncbi:MAG: M13 family metallopeptidase [Candidatus Micrarchaeales archaeon]|nr:M13 family metallopeptidase [Candidatus Micrarchaeales archaeon]
MKKKTYQKSKRYIGFSVKNMDLKVDPFNDFYLYSCGTWIKRHPLPRDKTRTGSFTALTERNYEILKKIAVSCAARRSSVGNLRVIGDFYNSFMDTKTVEEAGFGPVEELMSRIKRAKSYRDILKIMPDMMLNGADPLFDVYSTEDSRDSSVYALYVWQGGISLPDRDYYLKGEFKAIRSKYLDHMTRMFALYGIPAKDARTHARAVLRIETALARASRSAADTRDEVKNYNKYELKTVRNRYLNLEIDRLVRKLGAGNAAYVIVGQPEFLEAANKLVKSSSIYDLIAYFEWNLLYSSAGLLHSAAVKENFDFFGRQLLGQKAMQPRWKRAIGMINSMVGESIGELYVKENFSPAAEARAKALVKDIRNAFGARLERLEWMQPSTKKKALEKFDAMNTKLGHPKRFRDYSRVKTAPNNLFGNFLSAYRFELHRRMSRIGKKVDKNEWHMNAHTVNAYYDQSKNEIVLPAGIFQPPFFDPEKDDAINYAAIGGVIGHELTHGYDDQGSLFDKNGNLHEWWTAKDRANFRKRAEKVVKLYGALEIMPGTKINGRLTLGENIADLGGISIAYDAMQASAKRRKPRGRIDGFTQEQRFFISWAQLWKGRTSKGAAKMLAAADPHSPARFRGLIPTTTHPNFERSFAEKSKLAKMKKQYEYANLW